MRFATALSIVTKRRLRLGDEDNACAHRDRPTEVIVGKKSDSLMLIGAATYVTAQGASTDLLTAIP